MYANKTAMEMRTMALSISLATGSCRACAYEPVAFDAPICPRCAATHPNPGMGNRYAGRGVVIGGIAGALVCGVWGLLGWQSVLGLCLGAMLGSLPGMFFGLVGGLMAAAVARLFGI